ncbi:hypothetical protein BC826DRAFT_1101623 [Russula brevipes]|nr:hypothetical protein BC826DRAFT_1101623 [Russula brevipes]
MDGTRLCRNRVWTQRRDLGGQVPEQGADNHAQKAPQNEKGTTTGSRRVYSRAKLSADLADAERYREAYHNLLDEVGVLAARNQLAESEATRISQFNAEILGHNNPAQRIVYLDRVRRELAETKQMLIVATRERDAAGAQIECLRRELSLYLSVPAEGGHKPRTTMTRVGRMPLVIQSENVKPAAAPSGRGVRLGVGGGGDFEMDLPPLLADGGLLRMGLMWIYD